MSVISITSFSQYLYNGVGLHCFFYLKSHHARVKNAVEKIFQKRYLSQHLFLRPFFEQRPITEWSFDLSDSPRQEFLKTGFLLVSKRHVDPRSAGDIWDAEKRKIIIVSRVTILLSFSIWRKELFFLVEIRLGIWRMVWYLDMMHGTVSEWQRREHVIEYELSTTNSHF